MCVGRTRGDCCRLWVTKQRQEGEPSVLVLLHLVPALTVILQLFPDEILAAVSTPLFMVYAAVSVAALAVLAKLSSTRYGDQWVMIDVGICAVAGE